MSKQYKNRYWEVDDTNGVKRLHFTKYHKDEIILQFCQDKEDKDIYWYVSDLLNSEDKWETADNPIEAMEQLKI